MVLQEPKNQLLDIDSIQLDRNNPRIQRALDMYGDAVKYEYIALALQEGSSESEISGTTFGRLKNSIKTNRGIINPIVVNKHDGQYICVEGNTRLLIYRMFQEETGNDHWKKIPCRIYEDARQQEMDAIRLQAHLIGPRQWDPYAKARYVNYLWETEYMTREQIVDYCGGNKRQISRSIAAYKMVEEIYKPALKNPEDFDHTRFSGFVEFQDPRVHKPVYESGYKDLDFSMWLHERKFDRLEHVRRLPDILEHDEAKRTFLSAGSNEAIKILNEPSLEELMRKHDIRHILDAVSQKISRFGYKDIVEYREQTTTLTPVVDEALEVIQDFRNHIKQS